MKIIKEILPYIIIIIAIILIRTFIISPVMVDGGSMEKTLYTNDILILNKYIYKFNDINRYDVIAINHNKDQLVKRVIGLPNDRISYKDNKLYINGNEAIDIYNTEYTNNFDEITIPNDYYYVLGDNRTNSIDSRMLGVIHKDNIKGKLIFRVFPFNKMGWIK